MKEYIDLLNLVLNKGKFKSDRTGTGTYSVFGAQARYDLRKGFPIITTRKINPKYFIHEILWFLRGDTNKKYLNENGINLWDPWADKEGDLGRIYGAQWCDWKTSDGTSVNQIDKVIEQIKKNPGSRRLIVTAWNPGEIEKMSIPNCCSLFQFYVRDGELSCHLYQRSADLFLGVPINIGQYSLLTMMIAQVTGLKPGEFIHSFGDLHIYSNHIEQVKLQLARKPRPLPRLILNPKIKNIKDFKFEDIRIEGYEPHPAIKADISI